MESSSSSSSPNVSSQESCLKQAIYVLAPILSTNFATPYQWRPSSRHDTRGRTSTCESICLVHDNILTSIAIDDDQSTARDLLRLRASSIQGDGPDKSSATLKVQTVEEYIILQADLLRTLLVTSHWLLPRVVRSEEKRKKAQENPTTPKRHKKYTGSSGTPSGQEQAISLHLEETIERAQLLLHMLENEYHQAIVPPNVTKEGNHNGEQEEVEEEEADDGLPTKHPILENLLERVCQDDEEQLTNRPIAIPWDMEQLAVEEQELLQMARTPIPQHQETAAPLSSQPQLGDGSRQMEQNARTLSESCTKNDTTAALDRTSSSRSTGGFQEQIKALWPIETYLALSRSLFPREGVVYEKQV
jgi:hypothetical protein